MPESLRLKIYYLCIATGVLLSLVMFTLICRKKSVALRDAVRFASMCIVSAFLGVMLMAKLENAVNGYITDGTVYLSRFRLLGSLFLPPLALIRPMKSYRYSYRDIMDFLAPGMFLSLGVAKLGCAVYGCCYGKECTYGILSPLTGLTHFPVQLLEAALGIIIAVALFCIVFCEKKYTKGSIYPLGLIFFSAGRFVLEFFRHYELPKQEDLLLFMNFWQTVCLITFVAGVIWLLAVLKRNKKYISTV